MTALPCYHSGQRFSRYSMHPEVQEFVGLPEFTHWLLIPGNDRHFPFLKAVILDRHSCRKTIEDKGIRVFPIGSPPQGYPKKPIYR